MPGRTRKIPSYCRHKASGQAVVRIHGTDHYLGVYGSAESHERYRRIIALHYGNRQTSSVVESIVRSRCVDLTMVELIAAYWGHAKSYYVKNGIPTSEQTSIRLALRPVRELFGTSPTLEFGPLALETVRQKMIESGVTRIRINQHVGRIRRMFKWAVSKEMIPVTTYQALLTLTGLRKGRSFARESQPVVPVPLQHVEAVLPFLTAQVRAMVEIQNLLACRPGEIIRMRPCDIEYLSDDVWLYIPDSHKTEHHDRQRRIFIGKRAQAILNPWIDRASQMYCFSPKEARDQFDSDRRMNRKTPHTPSSRNRKRKAETQKKPGDRYTTQSYGRAIRKACDKAGVGRWTPNQIRHTRATEIRKKYGLEASQVVLGHSKADVTQLYAERDFELARRIVEEIG